MSLLTYTILPVFCPPSFMGDPLCTGVISTTMIINFKIVFMSGVVDSGRGVEAWLTAPFYNLPNPATILDN